MRSCSTSTGFLSFTLFIHTGLRLLTSGDAYLVVSAFEGVAYNAGRRDHSFVRVARVVLWHRCCDIGGADSVYAEHFLQLELRSWIERS